MIPVLTRPSRRSSVTRTPCWPVAVLLCLIALVLAGCALLHWHEARDTDQLLEWAGFRVRSADTPARRANLETMPPLQMVQRSKDGQVLYTYADPYNCLCLYVGDAQAYAAYQQLRQELAAAQQKGEIVWALWGL